MLDENCWNFQKREVGSTTLFGRDTVFIGNLELSVYKINPVSFVFFPLGYKQWKNGRKDSIQSTITLSHLIYQSRWSPRAVHKISDLDQYSSISI